MSKISIPRHLVSDDSMGEGWRDQSEAAKAFAAFLKVELPAMMGAEGDVVEFDAQRTGDSGQVNNACALVEIDGEPNEEATFRAQHCREQVWERFCNERGDLAA